MQRTESVMIKSIKIENLFEIFNYNIEYTSDESVLIITGPNGFGKTTILNILFNLFNKRYFFFRELVFRKIIVSLSNNILITIKKKENDAITFDFTKEKRELSYFSYSDKIHKRLVKDIEMDYRYNSRIYLEYRKTNKLSYELVNDYYDAFQDKIDAKNYIGNRKATKMLESIKIHYIREQRLLKNINWLSTMYKSSLKEQPAMIETTLSYSEDLRKLILRQIEASYVITQSLYSSYPQRLISEKAIISKEEYDNKFARLKEKQDKLVKMGIQENNQSELEYSESDAKALLVYLNDFESKLAVFDKLIEKLELFTNILNERRFSFKSISISRERGFLFKTINGKILELNQLSSGEQHELILLYELIFKTESNIFVLIDEPEISLHITWQKEFIKDLLRIVKIQKFQVLIATHSPSIINDRWDLVHSLKVD